MNLIKELFAKLNGWEKCNPPKWWSARREMNKWRGIPDSFKFKGKTFKYKAIMKSKGPEPWGSSESRFESAYIFFRKKRK